MTVRDYENTVSITLELPLHEAQALARLAQAITCEDVYSRGTDEDDAHDMCEALIVLRNALEVLP